MVRHLILAFLTSLSVSLLHSQHSNKTNSTHVLVRPGFQNNSLTPEWQTALVSRMSKMDIDSFAALRKHLTVQELGWKSLIESRSLHWNKCRDSLQVIFKGLNLRDTVVVLLGYMGRDDGFTFEDRTVCLDLTALQTAYGNADLKENENRLDRIFAHEYTHLLHKKWMRVNKYSPANFRDSVIWECFYEGLGMYRSLNPKWLPVNAKPTPTAQEVLNKLIPQFAANINKLYKQETFTPKEKEEITRNLSRGRVEQKWGAFPVALWLAMEEQLKPGSIAALIDLGPDAVILLANKYGHQRLIRLSQSASSVSWIPRKR